MVNFFSISPETACLSPRSSGPLPKSDSVQSLVSLMNYSSNISPASLEDCFIRGVDGNAETHSACLTSDTEVISLSGKGLKTVALHCVDCSLVARSLKEISLAANDLEVIDLSPLQSCQSLAVLSLNSNRISYLDLTPLKACTHLERLWLHDNRLESVDLTPIASCKSLRSLYLEDNSLHNVTLDLSPLSSTPNLRSLRLGGNRLGGKLDLTSLMLCPGLSVFNVDSAVTLVSDGESSQARVSPALRRIVLDIKFTGRPIKPKEECSEHRAPPTVSPKGGSAPPRLRRRVTPPGRCSPPAPRKPLQQHSKPSPIVKLLLIGFRRLARYAAEDSFSRCGKVMIRAASPDVTTMDQPLLLDSHLLLLYAPSEKVMRQIVGAAGNIPTVVLATERYRSTAEGDKLELLNRLSFYADPLDQEDTRVVYNMGKDYAMGAEKTPSVATADVDSAVAMNGESSPLSEEEEKAQSGNKPIRRSFSESSLIENCGGMSIELESIEDDDSGSANKPKGAETSSIVRQSRSADDISSLNADSFGSNDTPATTWNELTRRLRERKGNKAGRGWGSYSGNEMSMHRRNKLRAEQAAVEVAFHDLGGHATIDTCATIARPCGLPKCAGPVLFKAAYGSSFEIESTTPEAGVPNPAMERKSRKISAEAFMGYWNTRLKPFDGEERLSNVLEDGLNPRNCEEDNFGHSRYGAPSPIRSGNSGRVPSVDDICFGGFRKGSDCLASHSKNLSRVQSMSSLPTDISCPCDSGIELLITAFMDGRSSRFGPFALVKKSEAIAIGSSLVMHGLRGTSRNRVGGLARPVCPREVRDGKLNAALIAAEAGIFEGVAGGLSMDQIRSVKGCFATEASPEAVSRNAGLALSYTLTREEVQRFCISRKTLLPGAVQRTMEVHCVNKAEMSLGEFAVFLSVLNNLSSNGALDYFFSIVDTDHNEMWTLPDVRHFHMEKEELWLKDGMAVSELVDIWVNMLDMIRPRAPHKGIARRDLRKLGAKDRKLVLRSILFMDDDHSVLNIRRTMELNKDSLSPLLM